MDRRQFLITSSAAALLAACESLPDGGGYDVVVRGGTVFDGTGADGRVADVGLRGDRVAAVGDLSDASAALVVDAEGMAVAPGFINVLSWANESLLHDGRSQSDIRQGVTLEVMGEGDSMGPLSPAMKAEGVKRQGDIKYEIAWTTLGEYLAHLERRGVSTNVASFVGAATVRMHEVGFDNRKATPAQLSRMQDLVRAAMREGALGVGSSLIYAPGSFADTDELVALTAAAHEYGGTYISHIRSEADRFLEAIDELIEIGRRTGAGVQMYHMKPAGKANWHKSEAGLAKLNAARAAGIDVSANIYPYTAGATGLDAAMPLWVQEGGHDKWVARLKQPAIRRRVIREMRGKPVGWENLYQAAGGPQNVILIGFKNDKLKPLTGKTLAEVAQMRATSPEDTMIDLVIEDDSRVGTAYFVMTEENIRRNVAWPWTAVGSDAESLAPEGVFLKSNPHPRAYGAFARFFAKYVREEKVISLAEGVRRVTGLPAQQLRLKDRGRLAPGMMGDFVVFDPAKIQDHATFAKPHHYSTGVAHVFVNGVAVLRDGEHTGAKPGRFVRGPGAT
ncbi:MAG: D-aminoacylase [Alphaproteobacteria bacterium]|nr:D-aminoacylase [Alphaproteobacteria bacterium]